MIYKDFKFIMDSFFSLLLILIISPFFFLIVALLYFHNKGTPFFMQQRPGLDGNLFQLIKFKTMNDKRDKDGKLLPDKDRLTSLGLFLRKTSLDELPQLINVFKGDMSFVGPRPLLVEYLPLYNKEQQLRHKVKPGITGWAQVNGRNAISWKEKFNYDIWYVKNKSFTLDLKILCLTFLKVLQSKDVNANNTATTTKFKGNNL